MINGADIMVKCLEAEGVSVVFGYPGADKNGSITYKDMRETEATWPAKKVDV